MREAVDSPENSHHHIARRIERLEAEIAYRQLLLEEVIHRTKNTLQLAVAVFDEHLDAAGNAFLQRDLRNVQRQLRTLSRAHQWFYAPRAADNRSLNSHLSEICHTVFDSFGDRSGRIRISIAVAEVQLKHHQEISLSVILQELLTNALKHAFPCRRRGSVSINFSIDGDSICRLTVQDDGVGRSFRPQASSGLVLVEAFVSGLKGRLEIALDYGTTVSVSFPLTER